MKYSDLKELIKKSMLEVSPKSGEMTPEEEKMVADFEEREKEMDLTSGPSVVPGAVPMREGSVTLHQDEVYHKYDPLVKQYMEDGLNRHAAITQAEKDLAEEYGTTPLNIRSTVHDYLDDQENNATYPNEDILREADEIVAKWSSQNVLKEADMSPKYWVVAKDKRGDLYVFNDGYYNTKEEAENAFKNISIPKTVDADTVKVQAVPTSPNYTVVFNNLSKGLNEEMDSFSVSNDILAVVNQLIDMGPEGEQVLAVLESIDAWNDLVQFAGEE